MQLSHLWAYSTCSQGQNKKQIPKYSRMLRGTRFECEKEYQAQKLALKLQIT